MGKIFYYIGKPELEVLEGEMLCSYSATFVYQAKTASGEQVGFDVDLTGERTAYDIASGGLHYDLGKKEFFLLPNSPEELVQAVRKWPSVTVLGADQDLAAIRDTTMGYRLAETQNAMRTKRQLELKPTPPRPAALDLLGDGGRTLVMPVAEKILGSGAKVLIKWRRTDFGLHFYYVSSDRGAPFDLVEELARQGDLTVVRVKLEREIPVR